MTFWKFRLRHDVGTWWPDPEDAMRALRENLVPAAFLVLWMAVSAYTIDALSTMRAPRVIEGSMDVTVTSPVQATAHASCLEETARVAAGT